MGTWSSIIVACSLPQPRLDQAGGLKEHLCFSPEIFHLNRDLRQKLETTLLAVEVFWNVKDHRAMEICQPRELVSGGLQHPRVLERMREDNLQREREDMRDFHKSPSGLS